MTGSEGRVNRPTHGRAKASLSKESERMGPARAAEWRQWDLGGCRRRTDACRRRWENAVPFAPGGATRRHSVAPMSSGRHPEAHLARLSAAAPGGARCPLSSCWRELAASWRSPLKKGMEARPCEESLKGATRQLHDKAKVHTV